MTWDSSLDSPDDYPNSSVPNDDGDPTSDAAAIAARIMVLDAINDDSIVEVAAAKDSVVVLVAPGAEWSEPLAQAWLHVVRGERPPNSFRGRGSSSNLRLLLPKDSRSASVRQEDDQKLAEVVADGRGAIIAVHDIEALTPTERAAADLTIGVPVITSAQVRQVAMKVGSGDLPADITVNPCVTPAALRLSARNGQTSAEYMARLNAFMSAIAPKERGREQTTILGLDGLHGMDEAVAWGFTLARDMQAFGRGDLGWEHVDRGCLVSGPPGTGKTTFAKRLAAECGVPLVATSYSDWQSSKEGYLSDVIKAMRARFAEARKRAPCILFIDEIDSVQSRGKSTRHDDWWTAIINAILAEMDGIGGRPGVVVIAASNFAENVDPAIRRAGRLDREIRIPLPDTRALSCILSEQTKGDLDGVDLSPVAIRLLGGTGADCERALRGARRRARNAGRPLEVGDLLAEVGGRTDQKTSRRTAVHEAAHAVVVAVNRPKDIEALSIQEGGGKLGGLSVRQDGISGSTSGDVDSILRELLAGRAAEEVFFGAVSGGAGGSPDSDLARATLLAVSCEATWGLGGSLTWFGDLSPEDVGSFLCARPDVGQRVERRLAGVYESTLEVVRKRQGAISTLADVLLEREVMTGDEVRGVLASIAEAARPPRIVGKRVFTEAADTPAPAPPK